MIKHPFYLLMFLVICATGFSANSLAQIITIRVPTPEKQTPPPENNKTSVIQQKIKQQKITQQKQVKISQKNKSTPATKLVNHQELTPVSTPSTTLSTKKSSLAFQSLAQMNKLIEIGMPSLALSLLNGEQEKRQTFSGDWYAFEYKRIYLYTALDLWQQQIDRVQWLLDSAKPNQTTEKLQLWFSTQQVMAQLQLKQSKRALKNLQRLLWRKKTDVIDASLIPLWRRLVIRSYLQLQQNEDARKALVLYERDYKNQTQDIDWIILQAKVLLKTNRPQLALKQLQRVNTDDAKALAYIARLKIQPLQAKLINKQLAAQLEGKVLTVSSRWAYAYARYQIAGVLHDIVSQINSLETMLVLNPKYPVLGDDFSVSADDLWQLYSQHGLDLVNKNNLVLGNNQQWQTRLSALEKMSSNQALMMHVALALKTTDKLTQKIEHNKIVSLIEKHKKHGLTLIDQLYLQSKTIRNIAVLPKPLRYRLVDSALANGKYPEAARIMQSLKQPPAGSSVFDWRMRKARVLILKGDYQQSEKIIRQTFAENPKINKAELDRYMQVVFDFQTAQHHQQAIDLFALISFKGLSEKLQREIYFWKAESYFSLKKYDYAALSYLKSANAVNKEANDLWAQSARFKAGKALMLGKIYVDAEHVFKQLLAITSSETRQGIIKQNLQQLRLLKSVAQNKTLQKQNKLKQSIQEPKHIKPVNYQPSALIK